MIATKLFRDHAGAATLCKRAALYVPSSAPALSGGWGEAFGIYLAVASRRRQIVPLNEVLFCIIFLTSSSVPVVDVSHSRNGVAGAEDAVVAEVFCAVAITMGNVGQTPFSVAAAAAGD